MASDTRADESESGADVCEVRSADINVVRRLRPQVEAVAGLAELFQALADETRVKIAFLLSQEELCVCDLASVLGMSSAAVSHHLRTLRQLRLVRHRKEGRFVYYALDDEHVGRLLRDSLDHVRDVHAPHRAASAVRTSTGGA